MRAICLTSNKYAHCLPPFLHLWQRFYGLPITVAGYEVLPDGVETLSIGVQADYTWSGGVLKLLDLLDEDIILLVLEDYFLSAPVDAAAIAALTDLLRARSDVVKIDLSDDRLKTPHTRYGTYKGIPLVKSADDALFQMSTQAALWKTAFLRRFLDANDDAWQAEKLGTRRVIAAREAGEFAGVILGTERPPMVYVNAIGGMGNKPQQFDTKKFPAWMLEELSQWVNQD